MYLVLQFLDLECVRFTTLIPTKAGVSLFMAQTDNLPELFDFPDGSPQQKNEAIINRCEEVL